ncbi:hypothetical protein ASD43_05815 [Microbacterium sp. Root553]|nr:hypothetical protein ASD43_05815 [Microbacterium sp. Root553]
MTAARWVPLHDDDDGHVILSVTVFGQDDVPGLEALTEHREADGIRYDITTFSFDETDADTRADMLNDAILDRVALLTPAAEALHRTDVWVRFFLTLPHGAETIRAETVRALAAVNATLWIDA